MSEISLKAYQAELTDLLQQGRTDEVVRHCRHILEKYPKNVEVYRLMARALRSQSAEAAQIYRRVLSVFPDDAEAHEALSLYYQAQRKGNEAIWHLERAYEQNPNQRAIQAALTELYRQYRGMEVTRFQLTARAVALQHLRSGLYSKAIDTLQKALAQSPDRLDLQVLLAQVYWEAGSLIEAAERALALLKLLPDCLIANQILTLLWLSEQRPSDAQRYLSRIEAVDPYLAVTLAQGTPPDDDAFRLTRLDYQLAASRDLMNENPDWLQALGGIDTFADDETPADSVVATEEDQALLNLDLFDDSDLLGDDSTDEWLTQLDDLSQSTTQATLPTANREDLFGDDWLASFGEDSPAKPSSSGTGLTGLLSGTQQPRTPTGLTGLLSRLEADAEDEPEPPTRPVVYTPKPPSQEDKTPTATLSEDEEDPLAWMKETGIEILEEVPPSPFDMPFDDDDRPIVDPNADNPFAWMQTSDIELIDDEPQITPSAVEEAEADPLAWMRESGVELVTDDAQEEAAMSNNQSWFTEDDDNDADDLEWLSGAQSTPNPLTASNDEDDPLDWMLDPQTDAQPNETMPNWLSGAAPVVADDEVDVPDWLSSVGTPDDQDAIIPEAQSVPTWLSGATPAADQTDLTADDDDFDFTYEEDDTPDWLTAAAPIAESQPLNRSPLAWIRRVTVRLTAIPCLAITPRLPIG
ncbi:MAG: tetratricopeptide repeat protein [Anaerolineae bacterium]|nr:tetratricopeptide repeat protein [Anaerolineae bacterium]